jgi:hypothetical protein
MFTPTALMNPTITAFDTNRSTDPSLSNPAATMTTPVRIDSVNSAPPGSLASCTASTSATRIAIAPVPCTAMKGRRGHECAGNRPDHVAIEPGERVDTGEEPGCEAVGHALDAEHRARGDVLPEVREDCRLGATHRCGAPCSVGLVLARGRHALAHPCASSLVTSRRPSP